MFKTFFNIVAFFVLLLCNAALFTWCATHLELNLPLERTFINNVLAEAPPQPLIPTAVMREKGMAWSKSIHYKSLQSTLSHRMKSNQWVVVKFKTGETHLTEKERIKIENALQHLNIGHSDAVQVSAGATSSQNSLLSAQTAKLRAQSVARVIYPYTQTVKMLYRLNLEEGLVSVEFFQPPK